MSKFNSGFTNNVFFINATGTVGAPLYSFFADKATGIYNLSPGLGLSVSSGLRLSITSTALTSTVPFINAVGTVSAPAYSFTGDTNTGLYWISAGTLGISTVGGLRLTMSAASIISTVPFINAVGAVGAPAYSFTGETNTGMFKLTTGTLGFATLGTLRLSMSAASILSIVPYVGPVGTVTGPTYSFTGSLTTGLYSPTTDTIGITTGGALRQSISATLNSITTTLQVASDLYIGNGTTAAATQKLRLYQNGTSAYIDITGDQTLNMRFGASPTNKYTFNDTLFTIGTHVTYTNRQYLRVKSSTFQNVNTGTTTYTLLVLPNTPEFSEGSGFTWASSVFTNTSGYTKYYLVRIYTVDNNNTSFGRYHLLYINAENDNNYSSYTDKRMSSLFQVRLANNETFSPYIAHILGSSLQYGTTTTGQDQTRFVVMELA